MRDGQGVTHGQCVNSEVEAPCVFFGEMTLISLDAKC